MKSIFWLGWLLLLTVTASAQKETFDVLSYSLPPGWQKQAKEHGLQLAITDNQTGGYAMAVLWRAVPSTQSATENFRQQWATLVKGGVAEASEPKLEPPAKSNGWDVITGSGTYLDRGVKGGAILMSATSNGRTTAMVLMTNTQQFQNDLGGLLQSLDLTKLAASEPVHPVATAPVATASPAPAGLPGLWVFYDVETSGARFSNGTAMLTAGYLRREYLINPDGTYVYRFKNWSVRVQDIFYAIETGTWKVSGNQLTLTPKQGRAERWAKAASGRTVDWGAYVGPAAWKAETTTYTFDLHYYSGQQETHLLLTHPQATQRDGPDVATSANYTPRALDKSLIDNPPGR